MVAQMNPLRQLVFIYLWSQCVFAETFTIVNQPLGTVPWSFINPSVIGTGSRGTTIRFDQVAPPQGVFTKPTTIGRTAIVNGGHYIESQSDVFTLDCTLPSPNQVYTCKDEFTTPTIIGGQPTKAPHTDIITFGATTVVVSPKSVSTVVKTTSHSSSATATTSQSQSTSTTASSAPGVTDLSTSNSDTQTLPLASGNNTLGLNPSPTDNSSSIDTPPAAPGAAQATSAVLNLGLIAILSVLCTLYF